MADSFDPHYFFLGVRPADGSLNHYQLLKLELFESNVDIIAMAADRAMSHLHHHESGEHVDQVAQLMSEVSQARLCLLDHGEKTKYDSQLTAELDAAKAAVEVAEESRVDDSEPQTRLPAKPPPLVAAARIPQTSLAHPPVSKAPPVAAPSSQTIQTNKWVIPAAIGGSGTILLVVIIVLLAIQGNDSSDQASAEKDDSTGLSSVEKPNSDDSSGTSVLGTNDPSSSSSINDIPNFTAPSGEQLARYGVRIEEKGYVLLPSMLGMDREFTVEIWQRFDQLATLQPVFGATEKASGNSRPAGWQLSLQPSSTTVQLVLNLSQNSSTPIRALSRANLGELLQWHHIAVCRSPKKMTVFVNGQPKLTCTPRVASESIQIPFRIGLASDPHQRYQQRDSPSGCELRGLRVSSVARYDAPFAPPSKFQADSSTIALFDFSRPELRRIIDQEQNHDAALAGARWVQSDGKAVTLSGELPPIEVGRTWKSTQPQFGSLKKDATGWQQLRPVGPPREFIEIDHTDEYVELVAKQTPERLRIHKDRLFQWYPSAANWGPYVMGSWEESVASISNGSLQPKGEYAPEPDLDMRGFIGRVTNAGSQLPVLVEYQSGAVLVRNPLFIWFSRNRVRLARDMELAFQGILALDKETNVSVRNIIAPLTSVARVSIDGKDVSQVGGRQPHDEQVTQQLAKGIHTVQWTITGPMMSGVCDFQDEDGKRLHVQHDDRLLQRFGADDTIERVGIGYAVEKEALADLVDWFTLAGGRVMVMEFTTGLRGKTVRSLDEVTSPYFMLTNMTHGGGSSPSINDRTLAKFKCNPSIINLRLPECGITDAGLVHLSGLTTLRSLGFKNSPGITGEGLKNLTSLTELDALYLEGTGVTDETIKLCLNFPRLRRIDVRRTPVTEKGIATLVTIPSLREIHLGSPTLGKNALQRLAEMSQLEALLVSNTTLSDDALQVIGQLKTLKRLTLGDSKLSSDSLRHLTKLVSLSSLYITSVEGVDDTSLEYISEIPALTNLTVSNAPGVTDASLAALQNLKSLKFISISNSSVTEAGILELRKVLPEASTINVDGKNY